MYCLITIHGKPKKNLAPNSLNNDCMTESKSEHGEPSNWESTTQSWLTFCLVFFRRSYEEFPSNRWLKVSFVMLLNNFKKSTPTLGTCSSGANKINFSTNQSNLRNNILQAFCMAEQFCFWLSRLQITELGHWNGEDTGKFTTVNPLVSFMSISR